MTAWKVEPSKLLKCVNREGSRVRIGNFKYEKRVCALGDLSGNHFTVVLRDLVPDKPMEMEMGMVNALKDSLLKAKDRGFINYFGLQRFGAGVVRTHWIGRAILSNRLDVAVALILCARYETALSLPPPSPFSITITAFCRKGESDKSNQARLAFRQSLDYNVAISNLPVRRSDRLHPHLHPRHSIYAETKLYRTPSSRCPQSTWTQCIRKCASSCTIAIPISTPHPIPISTPISIPIPVHSCLAIAVYCMFMPIKAIVGT